MYIKYALLADVITQDATGKINAIGIFDNIAAPNFPTSVRDISLVASIEGTFSEKGIHKITIAFRDEDDNQLIAVDQNIEFTSKIKTEGNLLARVVLKLQDLPFRKPGQYQFVIFGDDRFLARITLPARKIEIVTPGEK